MELEQMMQFASLIGALTADAVVALWLIFEKREKAEYKKLVTDDYTRLRDADFAKRINTQPEVSEP